MAAYNIKISADKMHGKIVKSGDVVGLFIPIKENYIYVNPETKKCSINLVMSENQNKEFSEYSIKLDIPKEKREQLEEGKRNVYVGNANSFDFGHIKAEEVENVDFSQLQNADPDELPF